jgi:polyhydroxybutyrate depolymerase
MAAAFYSILISCCAVPVAQMKPVNGTTIEVGFDSSINGLKRTGRVHIPAGFSESSKYPLLLVVHGAFSTAEEMEAATGFSELADSEGFVVLYPEGMGFLGFLQHWNAGHCCGKAAEIDLDDVAFLREGIELLSSVLPIDTARIYMAGFSNGGMLVHRFAAEQSNTLAAAAVLGAAVGGRSGPQEDFWLPSLPDVPVPMLLFHGLQDDAVPADGGKSPRKGGTREYVSLQKSVDFWLKANNCSKKHTATGSYDGAVILKKWEDCANDSSVLLYTLEDWAHQWPGRNHTSESSAVKDFDAASIIWEYLSRFRR